MNDLLMQGSVDYVYQWWKHTDIVTPNTIRKACPSIIHPISDHGAEVWQADKLMPIFSLRFFSQASTVNFRINGKKLHYTFNDYI